MPISKRILTSFIVLKNKHERATNTALSDDLLVTLMMNKTRGQLQQHLRLQANTLKTFDQVLVIVKEYYQSKHLVSSKLQHDPNNNQGGPAPMDIGAAWSSKSPETTVLRSAAKYIHEDYVKHHAARKQQKHMYNTKNVQTKTTSEP